MFELKEKLTFININQDYLRQLHECCEEVYYKSASYENKPYLGILVNEEENLNFIITNNSLGSVISFGV